MSSFDNFDIDQISSKLAQREYFVSSYCCKKIFVPASLDSAENVKWNFFMNYPLWEAKVRSLVLKRGLNWSLHSGAGYPRFGTVPLAHPFARSLVSLTHSLAPHCLPCSRALLPTFTCSLTHSLTHSLVGKCMIRCRKMTWFCPIVRWSSRETLFFPERETLSISAFDGFMNCLQGNELPSFHE